MKMDRHHYIPLHFIVFIIVSTLCSVLYFNTLDTPFIFDDLDNIHSNQFIRLSEWTPQNIYIAAFSGPSSARPLANLSFALNYYFDGYNVTGYHLVNITIHIINGLLVYLLALQIFGRLSFTKSHDVKDLSHLTMIAMAIFAACIFVIHPLQTQSVTYIVQRMSSLAAMFYLLALLLYIYGRTIVSARWRWTMWITCFVAWLLALCSKQTAATLPFMVFLVEWYFFQDLNKKWLKQNIKYLAGLFLLFAVISLVYLGENPIGRILSGYNARDFSLGERVLTQLRVLVFYISLLIYPLPSRLNLLHDFPVSHSLFVPMSTLFSLFFLIGLLVLAVYFSRQYRLVSFCIFWFFINLIIESSVIGLELIFEHRLYLPMFAYALMLSSMLFYFLKAKPVLLTLSAIVLMMAFSIGTYSRNTVWADRITLWSDVVGKSPQSYRAHLNLGNALNHEGRQDDAIRYFHNAIALNPHSAKAHNNLGIVFKEKGNINGAIEHYYLALNNDPLNVQAYYNLGIAYTELGRLEEAIEQYEQALEINPAYANAHYNLANTLSRRGNYEQSIYHYQQAIEHGAKDAQTYNNFGIALASQGSVNAAIKQFMQAARIDPRDPNIYTNLGNAYLLKGNKDLACKNFLNLLILKSSLTVSEKKLIQYCNL